MKRGRKTLYSEIQELVREAQVERQAYVGALIGEGLAAAWQGMVRTATALGRGFRPKSRGRLVPR